jgi:quinol monooxygenase YgiN
MGAIVTVLEARVAPERAAELQAEYAVASREALPPGLVRSVLLRQSDDPTLWQIATTWESREALVAMRQAGGKPRGIVIFEAAGAQPSISIFEERAVIVR